MVHDPGCELIPFIEGLAIDADTPLYHLVLAGLKIGDDFSRDLGQVSPFNEIVGFQKDLTQARFSDWVVL